MSVSAIILIAAALGLAILVWVHPERKLSEALGISRRQAIFLIPVIIPAIISAGFVAELRQMVVTPHVAQKIRHSAIDGKPHAIPAMPNTNGAERRSRNPSAGPRPRAEWPKPSTAASTGSADSSR